MPVNAVTLPTATNLMQNPKPASLTNFTKSAGSAPLLVSDQSYAGQYSIYVEPEGSGETLTWYNGDANTLTGTLTGEEQMFFAAFRLLSFEETEITGVSLIVEYTDATSEESTPQPVVLPGSPNWQKVSVPPVSVDPAKTISRIGIRIVCDDPEAFYLGGADLRRNETPDYFISGDSPNSQWNGTANNSTSTRLAYSSTPNRGFGGQYRFIPHYYVVDRVGHIIGDITEFVVRCSISYDMLAPTVKGTMSLTMTSNEILYAWKDTWVRPHLTIIKPDGTTEGGLDMDGALGMFSVEPESMTFNETSTTYTYQGYDMIWPLQLETFPGHIDGPSTEIAAARGWRIPKGASYHTALLAILDSFGYGKPDENDPDDFDVLLIPEDTENLVAEWESGADSGSPVIDYLNDVCVAMGWDELYMNLQGKITTGPRRDISAVAPDYVFESGTHSDVRWPFSVDPEPDSFANRLVVVAKHSGYTEVFKVTARNMDQAHPFSYPNIRRWIDAPRFEARAVANISQAQRIARAELAKLSTLPYTVQMKTRAMICQLNSIYELNITDAFGEPIPGGHGQGKYWCTGWQMDLGMPWEMTHNLRRILPVQEPEIGQVPEPEDAPLISDLQKQIDDLEAAIKKAKRKGKKKMLKKIPGMRTRIKNLRRQIVRIEGPDA